MDSWEKSQAVWNVVFCVIDAEKIPLHFIIPSTRRLLGIGWTDVSTTQYASLLWSYDGKGRAGGGGGWDREGGRDLRSNFNMQSSSTGLFLIIFFSLIQVLLSWTQYFPFLKMFNIIFTVSFTSQSWFLQPSKFDCV